MKKFVFLFFCTMAAGYDTSLSINGNELFRNGWRVKRL